MYTCATASAIVRATYHTETNMTHHVLWRIFHCHKLYSILPRGYQSACFVLLVRSSKNKNSKSIQRSHPSIKSRTGASINTLARHLSRERRYALEQWLSVEHDASIVRFASLSLSLFINQARIRTEPAPYQTLVCYIETWELYKNSAVSDQCSARYIINSTLEGFLSPPDFLQQHWQHPQHRAPPQWETSSS